VITELWSTPACPIPTTTLRVRAAHRMITERRCPKAAPTVYHRHPLHRRIHQQPVINRAEHQSPPIAKTIDVYCTHRGYPRMITKHRCPKAAPTLDHRHPLHRRRLLHNRGVRLIAGINFAPDYAVRGPAALSAVFSQLQMVIIQFCNSLVAYTNNP
jgi:hypothetical protein